MSKRTLKSDDTAGFMLAVWDEMVDTEKLYGVLILTGFRTGHRRGEMAFFANAYHEADNSPSALVGHAEVVWPSHKYVSVHAMMLNLVSRLNIEVQKWYKERTGHFYSSPVD